MIGSWADIVIPLAILIGTAVFFYKCGVGDGKIEMEREMRKKKREERENQRG